MSYKLLIILLVLSTSAASFGVTQQEKLNRKLLKAVCQNNHAQVLMLLKNGADINTHDNWTSSKSCLGYTSLHYAVYYNYTKLVQLLLDFGAPVDSTDTIQRTPLHYAARDHKANLVELLLSHNAFVNFQDCNGDTPLHLTFEKFFSIIAMVLSPLSTSPDHYRTIELLLAYGANINAQAHNGQTSLHYAVKADLLLPVELLLVHGADITLQDNDGADALYCTSSTRIIELLLDFGATDEHWKNPTHAASARFYTDLGVSFNPLVYIKKSREQQTITYQDLLSKIHESNHNELKQQAFRQAIKNGYYTLVKLFVRSGIRVTLEDLALAKSQYKYYGNDFDHKSIGRFLFTYLQLFGLHSIPTKAPYLLHFVPTLLSRVSSLGSTQDNSLIGPISKKGIINSNYFTENIVHTIARSL